MLYHRHAEFRLLPLIGTLIALVILAVWIPYNLESPAPRSVDNQFKTFSAERAFQHLSQVLAPEAPHPVDSTANDFFRKALSDKLIELGYTPETQDLNFCENLIQFTRCARVRNLVVRIPGTQSSGAILVSAHYDSVSAGPGASDAGVAVAVLIELAEILKHQATSANDIILLFNEGEEAGLLGAKAFMQYHSLANQVKIALNVEARGTQGQSALFEIGENSFWLVEKFASVASLPLANSLFYEAYQRLPNDTDMTVFKQYHLQGLNFAHADQLAYYHTPQDNLAHLSLGSLQHHGDNIWGMLNAIRNLEEYPNSQSVPVFTDLLGKIFVIWPQDWTRWFVLLLWSGFLLVLSSYRRSGQAKMGSMMRGFCLPLVSATIACSIAWLYLFALNHLSTYSVPWRSNEIWMRWGIWLSILTMGLWLLRKLAANGSQSGLMLGLNASWLTLASFCSYYLPGASYLLILPAAWLIVMLGIGRLFSKSLKERSLSMLAILTVLAVSALYLPIVYAIEIMTGFHLLAALAILLSVPLSTLAPILVGHAPNQSRIFSKSRANLGQLAVVTGSSASVLFLVLLVSKPYSVQSPLPLNLIYLQKSDSTELWVDAEQSDIPDSFKQNFESLTVGYPFHWSSKAFLLASPKKGPASDLNQWKADWQSQQTDTTMISLQVQNRLDSFRSFRVIVPTHIKLISIEYEQQVFEIEQGDDSRFYQFLCIGESCQQTTLMMSFAESQASLVNLAEQIYLVQYQHGLPSEYQQLANSRHPLATPQHAGDQTIDIRTLAELIQ